MDGAKKGFVAYYSYLCSKNDLKKEIKTIIKEGEKEFNKDDYKWRESTYICGHDGIKQKGAATKKKKPFLRENNMTLVYHTNKIYHWFTLRTRSGHDVMTSNTYKNYCECLNVATSISAKLNVKDKGFK